MNRAERIILPDTTQHRIRRGMGNMATATLTTADNHTLGAYTAGPANATKGIVVIQEIFGVNSHIRSMADRFGAAGYKVVAPAMFDRAQKGIDIGYGPGDRKVG